MEEWKIGFIFQRRYRNIFISKFFVVRSSLWTVWLSFLLHFMEISLFSFLAFFSIITFLFDCDARFKLNCPCWWILFVFKEAMYCGSFVLWIYGVGSNWTGNLLMQIWHNLRFKHLLWVIISTYSSRLLLFTSDWMLPSFIGYVYSTIYIVYWPEKVSDLNLCSEKRPSERAIKETAYHPSNSLNLDATTP